MSKVCNRRDKYKEKSIERDSDHHAFLTLFLFLSNLLL